MYDIASYYKAESPAHAAALLREHSEARLVAGGSDVFVKMHNGELTGAHLVSIQHLDALRRISLDGDGTMRIGALVSFSRIEKDPLVQKHLRVLCEAAATVGGPQIRNVGTIGGNVCNRAPSADTAATLAAFDAVLEFVGVEGTTLVPLNEFYANPPRREVLTAVLIARDSYERTSGSYIKYAMRNAMDIATISCSVNVRLSGASSGAKIERLRVAFGVAGPVPVRAARVEAAAIGLPACEKSIEAVVRVLADDINPRDSWRASREFRMHIAHEILRRALGTATKSTKRGRPVGLGL